MAAVEDDSEFASHFLDSMLEVEMTEEDAELDISKNEDPLDLDSRTLPPIPTFDLQSETLQYKDVYKTSLIQPVLTSLPIVPTAENVSLAVPVINSGPMLAVYSGELIPAKTITPPVTKINATPVQKIASKLNAKPKTVVKEIQPKETPGPTQFINQVFKPEYIKNVFTKQESDGSDILLFGNEEMEYYKACFKNVSMVQYCRLHCTICDKHIGCGANAVKKATVHNMLKVMTCKPCYEFYGDGNFPCDQGDNCEIYCRWCGQGGALVCCSFCPRVFCKKCVRRNFGPSFLRNIQKASDWACFCCAQKPLWPHRAVCRALMEYLSARKTDGRSAHRDTSKCCGALLGRKQLNKNIVDKNKVVAPQPQLKLNPLVKTPVPIAPTKPVCKKDQPVLRTNVQVRINSPQKSSTGLKILKESPTTNILPRPIFAGNNIIRGITTSTPAKIFSTIPPAQLIQTPVIHGETLITPPGSRMLTTPKPAAPQGNSFVRISLTNQTANLDLSKIPTAKIPAGVQSFILRMSFPDSKVQLVRLINEHTNKCKTSKQFPMPEFKNLDKGAFLEENLADSFRVSKLLFDQLMYLKGKINSGTKETEESVLASSVEKLHFVFKKSAELLKDLDESLMERYEEWKNRGQNMVDVIDLSEDEVGAQKEPGRREKFLQKCKELVLSDDSDVEILDDVSVDKTNSENGSSSLTYQKVSVNGNFKQKYMLRGTSIERLKPHQNDKNLVVRKRRGRRGRRRPRMTDNSRKEEEKKSVVDQSAFESLMAKLAEARAKREGESEDAISTKRRKKQMENENPVENGLPIKKE